MPVLLLVDGLLYKTVKFKDPKYVGDPRIAVKIFNDKGADELVLLDIRKTQQGLEPDFTLIEEIATESFMPMAYGGGIRCAATAKKLFGLGVEKVIINTAAVHRPDLISEIADDFGAQSVVASIDAKKGLFGRYSVFTHGGRRKTSLDPAQLAERLANAGAGELLINSIDRDGTQTAYDIRLVSNVTSAVDIPVIACGGAGGIEDCAAVIRDGGASAAAAGSIFVFNGPHRAVLIQFPEDSVLRNTLLSPSG